MKNTYRKIYWTIAIVWGIIGTAATLIYALLFDDKISIEQQPTATLFWNIAYWTMVAMFIISIVGALGFAISQIVKGLIEAPKKQMKILVSVAALIVIFVILYTLASGTDIPQMLFEKTDSDYSNSKLIGASLYLVYALLAGVVLSVLYAEVTKKLK
jgi:FtsH-binding integral membrane protein